MKARLALKCMPGRMSHKIRFLAWIPLLLFVTRPDCLARQCGPVQVLQLQSLGGTLVDAFGTGHAISRRHLVVVAPFVEQWPTSVGALFVYERTDADAASMVLTQIVRIPGVSPIDLIGSSVDVDGDIIVLGVPFDDGAGRDAGTVLVFEKSSVISDSWTLVAKLAPSTPPQGAWFGGHVAVVGETIAVGAPFAASPGRPVGAVFMYERSISNPETWTETQVLSPFQIEDPSWFGIELTLDERRLSVGAPFHDAISNNAGAVYVFERNERLWELEELLTPKGLSNDDRLGSGLAMAGDLLFAGAPGYDGVAGDGAVYIYRSTPAGWTLETLLEPLGPFPFQAFQGFGAVLAAAHGVVYGGVPLSNVCGPISGAVLEFREDSQGGAWYQSALITPLDAGPNQNFGRVALADGILAVSAPKSLKPGAVYLFESRNQEPATTYCTGTAGSVERCVPALQTIGVPTVSKTSPFKIWSREVPGANFGLFLYTTNPRALPLLARSGICLPGGQTSRSGILWSSGTAGACDGVLDINWNVFGAALAQNDPALAAPGTTVHGQFVWFEPFGASALTWSDAVAFQLCP